MLSLNCHRTFIAFSLLVLPWGLQSQADDDAKELSLSELTSASIEQAALARKAKLREIAARQKGDQLKIYLKAGSGTYVNGKQINRDELGQLVREMGLKKAVITPATAVIPQRIADIKQFVMKEGITEVKQGKPKPVASAKDYVRLILARQKGDELKFYVNSRSIYLNGKSISDRDVAKIVRQSGLEKASVSAESYLTTERVKAVLKLVQDAGISGIQLTPVKQKK